MARFGQAFINSLTNPSYGQGLFTAAQQFGAAPAIMKQREQQSKAMEMFNEALYNNNPEEMFKLSQALSEKYPELSTQLIKAAVQAKNTNVEKALMQKQRETLSSRAINLGLEGIAEQATNATSEEQLRQISQDIRNEEIKLAEKKGGKGFRKAYAIQMGFTNQDIENLGLYNLTSDQFFKLMAGQETDLKAFEDSQGNEILLPVNKKTGKVKDPQTGRFVNASDLGVTYAPNKQRVEEISNFVNKELLQAGVENFKDLYESATTATNTLNNIETVLPLLDEMITGKIAEPVVFVRSAKAALANAIGLDPSDPALENTETFVSLAAPRVADIITAFGSGTGLSDADREFAKIAAGGDITQTATSLKRILSILKNEAENRIDLFKRTKNNIGKTNDPLSSFLLPSRKKMETQPMQTTQDTTETPPPPPGFIIN